MTANGQKLDGDNLQEVLDSALNADEIGRQQFFTPSWLAEAAMLPLPHCKASFVDLTMGDGALLRAAKAGISFGCDIDSRLARKPEGAEGDWHTINADLTKLYPLLAEVGWEGDLFGLNPPFSAKWENSRLATLKESPVESVRKTFKPGKEWTDSTLATMMIALDRMTMKGEGFLICNESTAIRFFGHPGEPASGDGAALRSHVWLWVTLPPGVFEDVRDFNTALIYFARSHFRDNPMHMVCPSADAGAVKQMLVPMKLNRASLRNGRGLWNEHEFCQFNRSTWRAAKEEYYDRYRRNTSPLKFNVWLKNGRIKRDLTPFQTMSSKIPKDLIQNLQHLEGRTPMELVVQRETRAALQRAIRTTFWKVDPDLITAVETSLKEYNSHRAPFYPLSNIQRLGFLDENDEIQCANDGIPGFITGEFYPIACSTAKTERRGTITNVLGEEQDVTWYGQDLLVKMQDSEKVWHAFTTSPETAQDIGQAQVHHITELVEHFHIPDVDDVAKTHKDRYEAHLRLITEIENRINGVAGAGHHTPLQHTHTIDTAALAITTPQSKQGFHLRGYQRDDLARAAIHDGAIIGWDPGLGKTIALFMFPQIKRAKRTLLVAPDSLHQQIIDEGRNKFGIEVRPLSCQEDFYNDKKLKQAWRDLCNKGESDEEGWWITSYTQLGQNGADESKGKEDSDGEFVVSRKTQQLRQTVEHYRPEWDQGCGEDRKGIRCCYRPSLASLVADIFDCVEIDEGVRLKSNDSYVSLGVRRLRPKYRAVMTGTPIKNRLPDIFWLCHWAAGGHEEASARWPYPNSSEAKAEFESHHTLLERNWTREQKHFDSTGKSKRFEKRTPQICNVHRLWKLLCNVVIRRRKDDVGEDIVPKTITPIRIPAGTAQQAVYKFHCDNPPDFNKGGKAMDPIAKIVTQLQNLRQAALCPDTPNLSWEHLSLFRVKQVLAEEIAGPEKPAGEIDQKATTKAVLVATKGERTPFEAEAKVAFDIVERMLAGNDKIDVMRVLAAAPSLKDKLSKALEHPTHGQPGAPKHSRSWTDFNPKQAAILKLIEDLMNQGEQCVVMSPFQHFSETLYQRLVEAGVSVCLLDGNTNPKKRGLIAREFKRGKYAVLIGGIQSMGEGHSFECCSHLIIPSLEWAWDKNRQAEDRVHRLTSKKPVTIYTMVTNGTIDARLESMYREKGDSSSLALDGRLFADNTEEINLGKLLSEAIRNFNPNAETIDESDIEKEWKESLKHRLGVAQRRFREWHPPIVPDVEGNRVTKAEVKAASDAAEITPAVRIAKAVPDATFGALIESRDGAMIAKVKADFLTFCQDGRFKDWRQAWREFDKQRDKKVTPTKAALSNALAALRAL